LLSQSAQITMAAPGNRGINTNRNVGFDRFELYDGTCEECLE
jgi:hypothetical protein